jgi:hypothetical protein
VSSERLVIEAPARVVPGSHIDDALQNMIRAGIRSLPLVHAPKIAALVLEDRTEVI